MANFSELTISLDSGALAKELAKDKKQSIGQ
jgi:hypothetical protein